MKHDSSSPIVIIRYSLVTIGAVLLLVGGCGGGDAPSGASHEADGAAGSPTDAIRDAGAAAGKQLKDAADAVADTVDQAAAAAAAKAEAAKAAAAEQARQAKAAAADAVNDASEAVGKAATDAAIAVNKALPKPADGAGMVVHTDPESGEIIPSPAPGTPPVGGDVKIPGMGGN